MRHPISTSYITPIKSDGTEQVASASEFGRGTFTLAAGTYYYPLGGQDSPVQSCHFQWDATIAITSITVEDCNMPESEVPNYSTVAGAWIDEDPSTAFVGTVGAGTTVTNGVVAHTAGAAGGCMFHIADTGARRTRLAVVVGTEGDIRCSAWGKE